MKSIHRDEVRDIVLSFSPPLYFEFSYSGQSILLSYKKNGKYLIHKHMLPFDSQAKDLVYINNILKFFDLLEEKVTPEEFNELKARFHL